MSIWWDRKVFLDAPEFKRWFFNFAQCTFFPAKKKTNLLTYANEGRSSQKSLIGVRSFFHIALFGSSSHFAQ
jgi:hypothetical protein